MRHALRMIGSITLGVTTCVAWAASYRVGAALDWTWLSGEGGAGRSIRAVMEHGGIGVAWSVETDSDRIVQYVTGISWKMFEPEHAPFLSYPEAVANRIGFGYDRVVNVAGGSYSETSIAFPFWMIVCIAAMFPTITAMRRFVRVRRIELGRCASCGYDIRFSQQKCPECGLELARRTAEA